MFIWFDSRKAEMAKFKETFGVQFDISSFTNLVRKWEGGEHSVKISGETLRGLIFRVDYLPRSLVMDIFNLVNISIFSQLSKRPFLPAAEGVH